MRFWYRIITDDWKTFIVQKRFWLFFWTQEIQTDTLPEAVAYVQNLYAHKWKVCWPTDDQTATFL